MSILKKIYHAKVEEIEKDLYKPDLQKIKTG